ncbi:MAG: hypothetical protein KME13_27165 [Myxacorys californica WJT36-NPBG1]|jgi:hypothetical protein|nr:hypothetical protein [Myxacorys californica WJT36-NPBG1]
MEPLSMIAAAVGAAIATAATKFADKAAEKLGEKSGEKVFTESEKFLAALKEKAPETALAIEQSAQKPLDLGKAVLEVEAVAKQNPAIAQSAETVAAAAEADPNPELQATIQQVLEALKAYQLKPQSSGKRADKIGAYAEQGDVNITTLNMD